MSNLKVNPGNAGVMMRSSNAMPLSYWNGGERSAVQLSRELGVSDCSLGKWKRQYGKAARSAQSGAQAEQSRIAQLERQVEYLSRQRDILKKALAILGQEPSDSTK